MTRIQFLLLVAVVLLLASNLIGREQKDKAMTTILQNYEVADSSPESLENRTGVVGIPPIFWTGHPDDPDTLSQTFIVPDVSAAEARLARRIDAASRGQSFTGSLYKIGLELLNAVPPLQMASSALPPEFRPENLVFKSFDEIALEQAALGGHTVRELDKDWSLLDSVNISSLPALVSWVDEAFDFDKVVEQWREHSPNQILFLESHGYDFSTLRESVKSYDMFRYRVRSVIMELRAADIIQNRNEGISGFAEAKERGVDFVLHNFLNDPLAVATLFAPMILWRRNRRSGCADRKKFGTVT